MPKMFAIPQLVSAPLNPIPIAEHFRRSHKMFNKFEAIDLLNSLVRLARSKGHQKAEEYAAAQDEIRARMDSLDAPQLQRLYLGLLGDPVRTMIAKEATTILKGVTKDSSPPPDYGRVARRQALYPSRPRGPQCFRCFEWGHVARTCRRPSVGRQFGRGRARNS